MKGSQLLRAESPSPVRWCQPPIKICDTRRRTMTTKESINSPQKTARVAAFVFLLIFFLGMSAELFIRPGMIVPGDAAATVRNIAASQALFRLSLVSELVRQALLMLLPLILYKLLKQVDNTISSLMVIFALVCV